MKSYEEIDKKWQEIEDAEESLRQKYSRNFKIAFGNIGIWGLSFFLLL